MRPEILYPLFAEVRSLPGVGPRTAPLFEKLGAQTVGDLLFLAPSGVIDRRPRDTVQGAPEGMIATVTAKVLRHRPGPRKTAPYRVDMEDAKTAFSLVFFRAHPEFLLRALPVGEDRIVSGKLEIFDGYAQIAHPDYILAPEEAGDLPSFEPVYPLTAGLTAKIVRKAAQGALAQAPDLPEWQDAAWMKKQGFAGWRESLVALHAPASATDASPGATARRRLAYDELLAHQLALALVRAKRKKRKGRAAQGDGRLRARLLGGLPYAPTGAQTRAAAEIAADMGSPERMMRLLQGDVGAGKTLVALMAMLLAVEAGGQAALMAPTEILARQHLQSLAPLLEPLGLRAALLSGRSKGAGRAALLADIASGAVNVVIGTHALFQADVAFHDLRLAVVDEQHRFGVEQRMELAEKGQGCDVLVMTATPIPRTLALASYGDMDISVLDEKPAGRKPIETRLVSLSRMDDVVAGLRRAVAEGKRAYWICPLVEESDMLDVAAAEDRARMLSAVFGPQAVALAHGRLKGDEKDAAMERFRLGEAQILVATTVVEVGVNVPEATIMIIEHAERFGLAQLHQLRGRVGRGDAASSCVLLYQGPLGETARARLAIMRETEDGFRIAEEDLRLRGAGDLLGVRQAGAPVFHIADWEAHADLLEAARDDARLVLTRDPDLADGRGQALRALLYLMKRDSSIRYLSSG